MTFVWSNTNRIWLAGIPIRSQMIPSGSGAASSVTKSHSPLSITWSTTSVAPRDTMRRRRPCRGSSMLIMEPKNSLSSGGRSGMLIPWPEQNTSERRLASTTSAWRVSDQ
jgi:hypothetical protein